MRADAGVDKTAMMLVAETSYAPDAKPRHVAFDTQPTRYIQIEVLESHGLNAIIAEVRQICAEEFPDAFSEIVSAGVAAEQRNDCIAAFRHGEHGRLGMFIP